MTTPPLAQVKALSLCATIQGLQTPKNSAPMNSSGNDLYPCGSGKKYKHCCLRENDAPVFEESKGRHEGAAERAIEWLSARHRKAMRAAFDDLRDDPLAQENVDTFGQLDDETETGIQIKGLLRSYEAGEKMQASQQGRYEVSYNFLWEAIGVKH